MSRLIYGVTERITMRDFIEGLHKVGESMSAVISAQVTREAQDRLACATPAAPAVVKDP